MTWLVGNADAIQAIAAVLNACVAFALVWLTARYVMITRELSNTSTQQAKLLARQVGQVKKSELDSRKRKAASLSGLCQRIRVPTSHLDPKKVTAQISHNFTYLSTTDAELISTLAGDVSIQTAEQSEILSLAIRQVINLLEQVQSDSSWTPSLQQATDWKGALETIATRTAIIEQECARLLSVEINAPATP